VLQLFQAEWCPYSRMVREHLTELGIDFVARQVAPWPEQREGLRRATGQEHIPALLAEDGTVVAGPKEIIAWLDERYEPWEFEAEHRQRWIEHKK
jgi:glutathione S-transferase